MSLGSQQCSGFKDHLGSASWVPSPILVANRMLLAGCQFSDCVRLKNAVCQRREVLLGKIDELSGVGARTDVCHVRGTVLTSSYGQYIRAA